MAVPRSKIVYVIKLVPHSGLMNAPGLRDAAKAGTLTVPARCISPIAQVAQTYFFGMEQPDLDVAIVAGGNAYMPSAFDKVITELPQMQECEVVVYFGEVATNLTNEQMRVLTVHVNMHPKVVPFGLSLTPPSSAPTKRKGPEGHQLLRASSKTPGSPWVGTSAYGATNAAVYKFGPRNNLAPGGRNPLLMNRRDLLKANDCGLITAAAYSGRCKTLDACAGLAMTIDPKLSITAALSMTNHQASNAKTWLGGTDAAALVTKNDPSATNFSRLSYSENFGKYQPTVDIGDLPSELEAPYAFFLSRSVPGSATASAPTNLGVALAAAAAMVSMRSSQPATAVQTPAAATVEVDEDEDVKRRRLARARREQSASRIAALQLEEEAAAKRRKKDAQGKKLTEGTKPTPKAKAKAKAKAAAKATDDDSSSYEEEEEEGKED